jgi:hypothetical protein
MADPTETRGVAVRALVLLTNALVLLSSSRRWTRKGYALDGRGRQVAVDDARAVRFCTIGAVLRAEHELTGEAMPVATNPDPEVEDLELPVGLRTATHVRLALDALGFGSFVELEKSGQAPGLEQGPVSAEASVSLRHLPMLLGLNRRTGHQQALNSIAHAISLIAETSTDTARLERMLTWSDRVSS